jgi:hypothetical protein
MDQLLLSPNGGCCYLVLVEENKPKEIAEMMRSQGLTAEVSDLQDFESQIILRYLTYSIFC